MVNEFHPFDKVTKAKAAAKEAAAEAAKAAKAAKAAGAIKGGGRKRTPQLAVDSDEDSAVSDDEELDYYLVHYLDGDEEELTYEQIVELANACPAKHRPT